MLGVSHAATVGFNFQCNYCSAASYSGAPVTAPAFGIGTNAWESLTPMDTGYGCTPGYFTLDQVIGTTSTGSGLNPLPNGSVHVTWSAYTANVSGFGGYDRSSPHYTFGGTGHRPGEEEVYWGFLRDGVNFGPGSSGGDNNQPGYAVDIVGLKSLFTNSAFVVELIASGDSIQNLTNAFVIDATASTTQAVSYPNIPPVGNVGDTAWTRGVGGGLSTVSGPVNTDHLKIIGNRAQHSAGPPSFNNASTIAGFIITDKPVVSMSPQPLLATPGDTVLLRPIAVGVPPLAYQWRNGGVPVPGATNLTYSITNITVGGDFDLVITNLYGATTSKVATVTVDRLAITPGPTFVLDSKPSGTKDDGENFGATWLASSVDSAGTNRVGVMQFAATNAAQIVLPTSATTNFDSGVGTIMFWMRSAGTVTNRGSKGAMLFDRLAGSGVDLVQADDGTILVHSPSGAFGDFSSTRAVSDTNWHHIAFVYEQTSGGLVNLYIDGAPDSGGDNAGAWTWPAGQEIELGRSHDSQWRPYDGLMDDFRVYSRELTQAEIASVVSTAAVVDPSTLQVRFSFDAPPVPGLTVSWQSGAAVLQSADAVTGPYTDLPSAASPYYVEVQPGPQFYRYRHAPVLLNSNPFDM